MNDPTGAAALITRLSLLGRLLGCPSDGIAAYLAARSDEHSRYTRVEVPDTFDAVRLLTYTRGAPELALGMARKGLEAAGVRCEIPVAFTGASERLEADGLYSGIRITAAGPASMVLLLDASSDASGAFDALGLLGVPGAARAAAQSALQPLSGYFRTTVGLLLGDGAPRFEIVSKCRFDAPDEVPLISSRIAGAMRNLGIPDMHTAYVEENFGMFNPAGTHEVLVGVRLEADGVVPALDLGFKSLPSNFVLDVMLDFGAPRETGGLIGRMEGVLGRTPDGAGAYWVDGLTLTHAGEGPPRTSLSWVPDAAAIGARVDPGIVPADLRAIVDEALRRRG